MQKFAAPKQVRAREHAAARPKCPTAPAVSHCRSTATAAKPRHCARNVEVAASNRLGDIPIIVDNSLLGGSPTTIAGPQAPTQPRKEPLIDDVPLTSEAGIDYSTLKQALKEGDFRKADDETRALLIKLAGPDAVKRNWVYFTEVKFISNTDLQTLNNLWKAGSNGRFGYSVQKEIFLQQQQRWPKFFKQIDWTVGENNNYRKWPGEFNYTLDAPKGHLPLTNALRGTQLFLAILEHPAFNKPSK